MTMIQTKVRIMPMAKPGSTHPKLIKVAASREHSCMVYKRLTILLMEVAVWFVIIPIAHPMPKNQRMRDDI